MADLRAASQHGGSMCDDMRCDFEGQDACGWAGNAVNTRGDAAATRARRCADRRQEGKARQGRRA
eukprot:351285-Chlamydomonas_euryale.AAC.3